VSWSSKEFESEGKLRLCQNYSLLNSLHKDDAYTMNPANIIKRAAKCKYLSKIDLCQAFYQITLSKERRKFMAIRTFCGHFEYTVGSFGLKYLPKTFQRLANKILRPAQGYACSHLDDFIIWSKTF
jgi:Reverse transcriptase (RNA-dependent DNA polymerase)